MKEKNPRDALTSFIHETFGWQIVRASPFRSLFSCQHFVHHKTCRMWVVVAILSQLILYCFCHFYYIIYSNFSIAGKKSTTRVPLARFLAKDVTDKKQTQVPVTFNLRCCSTTSTTVPSRVQNCRLDNLARVLAQMQMLRRNINMYFCYYYHYLRKMKIFSSYL